MNQEVPDENAENLIAPRRIVAGGIEDFGQNISWAMDHADLDGLFKDVGSPHAWSKFTLKDNIAAQLGMSAADYSRAQTGRRGVNAAELQIMYEYLRFDRHLPPIKTPTPARDLLRLDHAAFVATLQAAGWGGPNHRKWLEEVPALPRGLCLVRESQWVDPDLATFVLGPRVSMRNLVPRGRANGELPSFRVSEIVAVAIGLSGRRRVALVNMNSHGELHAIPGPDPDGFLRVPDNQLFVLTSENALQVQEPPGEALLIALVFDPDAPRLSILKLSVSEAPRLTLDDERKLRRLLEISPRPDWLRVHRFPYRIR